MGLDLNLLRILKKDADPVMSLTDPVKPVTLLIGDVEVTVPGKIKIIDYWDGEKLVETCSTMRKNYFARDVLQDAVGGGRNQCDYYILETEMLARIKRNFEKNSFSEILIDEEDVIEFRRCFNELIDGMDCDAEYAAFSWIS